MEKKDKIIIALIVALTFVVGVALGYVLYQKAYGNTPVNEPNDNSQTETKPVQNEEEEKIVAEDVGKLLNFLNNKTTQDTCFMQMFYDTQVVDEYITKEDLFSKISPCVMQSLYNKDYVKAPTVPLFSSVVIATEDQVQELNEYFVNSYNFTKYDDSYDSKVKPNIETITDEIGKNLIDEATSYYNKDYYVLYEMGDGYGIGEFEYVYRLEDISKKDGKYVATINAQKHFTTSDTYEGNYRSELEIEVVNGHSKFGSLNFKRI